MCCSFGSGKIPCQEWSACSSQEVEQNLQEFKKCSGKRQFRYSELFRRLQKHFNVKRITLLNTVYIVENKYPNIDNLLGTIERGAEKCLRKNMNGHVMDKVGGHFSSALSYCDTKKDRDILKALFVKATSTRFVANLIKIKNKSALMSCRDELGEHLNQFKELYKTCQIVRNDMTCERQKRLSAIMLTKRKEKLLQLPRKHDNRGRQLKAEVFPQLGMVLENIFQQEGN